MSGLTPTGFETKSLADIIAELEEQERANIRQDLVSSSTSIVGILNGIMGTKYRELWEVAEAIYASLNRDTAEAAQLDNIGRLIGIDRQGATSSTVLQSFSGTAATLIPAGSIISDPASPSKKFSLDGNVTLDGSGVGTGMVTATVLGPVVANAGTLTKIDTPIAGWASTTNVADAEQGRNTETDAAYRLRQSNSLAGGGSSTYPALRTALTQLLGVTNVNVYANTSSVTVDGAPPHTVEAVIEGGTDQDIYDVLFDFVGMGISTYGNTSGTVTDDEGNVYVMKFSRPVATDIKVNATLDKDPSKYIGDAAWKQALADYVNALLPGKEVVTSKLEGFAVNLGGVADTTLFQIALLADSFGVANVPITRRQVARLLVANVTLVSSNET